MLVVPLMSTTSPGASSTPLYVTGVLAVCAGAAALLLVAEGVLQVREWRLGMAVRAARGKPTAPWRTPAWLVGMAALVVGFAVLAGVLALSVAYQESMWRPLVRYVSSSGGDPATAARVLAPYAAAQTAVLIVVMFAMFMVPIAVGLWQRHRIRQRDHAYAAAVLVYRTANPTVDDVDPADPYLELRRPLPRADVPSGARILTQI